MFKKDYLKIFVMYNDFFNQKEKKAFKIYFLLYIIFKLYML